MLDKIESLLGAVDTILESRLKCNKNTSMEFLVSDKSLKWSSKINKTILLVLEYSLFIAHRYSVGFWWIFEIGGKIHLKVRWSIKGIYEGKV